MQQKVIVGIDGSVAGEAALVWAARAAAARGAQLTIAHAGDVMSTTERALGDEPDFSQQLLSDAVTTALETSDNSSVVAVLKDSAPAQLLSELSAGAAMLVVGTRGEKGVAGALLGSVAHRVVAQAQCPVVVVSSRWRDAFEGWVPRTSADSRQVVVGISTHRAALATLEFAFDEAGWRSVPLVALQCVNDHSARPGTEPVEQRRHKSERASAEEFAGWVDQIGRKHPDVRVRTEFSSLDPAQALVAAGASAELVVVGSQSQMFGPIPRLGAVTSALLRRLPCPVAVVGHHITAAPQPDPVSATPAFPDPAKTALAAGGHNRGR